MGFTTNFEEEESPYQFHLQKRIPSFMCNIFGCKCGRVMEYRNGHYVVFYTCRRCGEVEILYGGHLGTLTIDLEELRK